MIANTKHENSYAEGLHHLEYRHLDEVVALLTNSFLNKNKIWSKYPLSKQKLDSFFREVVTDHLQRQRRAQQYTNRDFHVNMILVHKGKIFSVLLHYEIQQYRLKLQQESKPPSIELFRRLEKYGKQLLKGIDLNGMEKGKFVYANFGAADDQNITSKMVNEGIFDYCSYLYSKGIKGMIGRSSNVKANGLYTKLGGKVLKIIEFNEEGIIEPMSLIYIEFNNPIFSELLKLKQKKSRQNSISAKL